MKRTKGEKIFGVFNVIFLAVLALAMLYPLIYVIVSSLSDSKYVIAGDVWFWPKGTNLSAYKKVMEHETLGISYANSIFYLIAGTAMQMVITTMGAFSLSRKRLIGRKTLNFLIMFTMWFGGGMIPFYLTMKDYHLLDSRWGIILGFACNAYNFILLRTFFASIPDALEEAAKIDGANDFYVMCRIFIPLSLPSLATIALFYGVANWNSYFWPMILLTDDRKIPLQVLLKKMVVDMTGRMDSQQFGVGGNVASESSMPSFSEETFMYATMVLSIIPMLVVYPFVQKYFVKGIMMGSIKG